MATRRALCASLRVARTSGRRRNPGLRPNRAAAAALAAGLALACGDAPTAAPGETPGVVPGSALPGAEQTPVIEALRFKSDAPVAGEELELKIDAHDRDGDPLATHVQWYVNGQLYREGPRTRLDTSAMHWGDQVYAVVRVSNGRTEQEKHSLVLVLGNARPRVIELILRPAVPLAAQPSAVTVKVEDRENDPVSVSYEWLVDGRLLGAAAAATLDAGRLKRGQRVRVRVAASDGRGQGPWAESDEVVVGNTGPLIGSEPTLELAGPRLYEYRVQASDPDGDRPLRYQLLEAPDGMEMDVLGLVSWRVPRDAQGTVPVEIQVSDGHGGSARQSYEIALQWETVPAAGEDRK
jgi:hypothetical protein